MFLAIRPVTTWHIGWPLTIGGKAQGLTFSNRPMVSANRTLSAQGVQEVQIEASLGSVAITAASTSALTLHWTAPAGAHKWLTTTRQGSQVIIHFSPPKVVSYGSGLAKLDVTLPAGLAVTANLDAGSMSAQGKYGSLAATLQAGSLSVSDFSGTLSAHDNLGAINVQRATITGPLSLIADLGPITFTGDPGLAATIQDQMGPIALSVSPSGKLAVQGSVQMGSFSSGIRGLGSHSGGQFSGSIGQGPPGYLHVSDQMGPVSINQR